MSCGKMFGASVFSLRFVDICVVGLPEVKVKVNIEFDFAAGKLLL